MPRLEIKYEQSSNSFGYVVINNGLGPAIIVNKKIFVDCEEIENSGFSGIDDFLNKLNLKDRLIDQKSMNPGHIVRAGDFQNLFYFTLSGIDDWEKLLINVYNRVTIKIEYKSIYSEVFTCETK